MPHWPQPKQWADRVVPVEVEDLADCLASLGRMRLEADGTRRVLTADAAAAGWRSMSHGAVDAYILPQPDGMHSAGIRYGADEPEYLSLNCDQGKLAALLEACNPSAGPHRR